MAAIAASPTSSIQSSVNRFRSGNRIDSEDCAVLAAGVLSFTHTRRRIPHRFARSKAVGALRSSGRDHRAIARSARGRPRGRPRAAMASGRPNNQAQSREYLPCRPSRRGQAKMSNSKNFSRVHLTVHSRSLSSFVALSSPLTPATRDRWTRTAVPARHLALCPLYFPPNNGNRGFPDQLSCSPSPGRTTSTPESSLSSNGHCSNSRISRACRRTSSHSGRDRRASSVHSSALCSPLISPSRAFSAARRDR